MKITRFEDIQAWQEARKLVKLVYDMIKKNQEFKRDLRLVSQIQAAAVSSMANIAEGFSREGNKDSIPFHIEEFCCRGAKTSLCGVGSELHCSR
jgi:hypothetical protein